MGRRQWWWWWLFDFLVSLRQLLHSITYSCGEFFCHLIRECWIWQMETVPMNPLSFSSSSEVVGISDSAFSKLNPVFLSLSNDWIDFNQRCSWSCTLIPGKKQNLYRNYNIGKALVIFMILTCEKHNMPHSGEDCTTNCVRVFSQTNNTITRPSLEHLLHLP